jgi:hypothetical protein
LSKFVENWQSSENVVISIDIFRTLDLMKIPDWFDIKTWNLSSMESWVEVNAFQSLTWKMFDRNE